MNDPTALARQHFMDGVVHFEASRLGDAERCFEAALALVPGRLSVLTNLGATRVRLGKFAEAAPLLRQAFATAHDALGPLVSPALLAHRAQMFAEHLAWPIAL